MKNLLLSLIVLVATVSFGQMADYELHELRINVNQSVDDCEVTLIIDDVYYPVQSHQVDGSIITLYLAEHQDYNIIINCETYISISLLDREVIDERELEISADVDYAFQDGVLVFEY